MPIISQLFSESSSSLLYTTMLCCILLYSAFKLSKKLFTYRQFAQTVNQLPGPVNTWNPIGHFCLLQRNGKIDPLLDLLESLCALAKTYAAKHSLFRIWVLHCPVVVIFKADTAEKILTSTVNINKSIFYFAFRSSIGKSIILRTGTKWTTRRRLLNSTFHVNMLEQFLPIMTEQSVVLVEKIRKQVAKAETGNGTVIDIVPYMSCSALDIICECAMGVKIDSQNNPNTDFVQAFNRASNSIMKRIIQPLHWLDCIYFNLTSDGRQFSKDIATLHGNCLKLIKERKAEAEAVQRNLASVEHDDDIWITSGRKRIAFLDFLINQHLHNGETWTEDEMVHEVEAFKIAGHETTAMSLIWTLLLLGNHPVIQAKLHEEIDQLWERDSVSKQNPLNSVQLRELKYLEACIKESLRLYPSVPYIGRTADTDISHEEYLIPKGSTILVFIYMIQHDPKVFPSPESFIPERFIEGSEHFVRIPFAFVPFSAGPRNCIGQKFAIQEEKVVLANVLRHFRLEAEKRVEEIELQPQFTLRQNGPVKIRFIQR